MILPVFSLLMFEHSAFAKANSSDLIISEYIVSMIINEKVETGCDSEEGAVADSRIGWNQAERVNERLK